MSLQSTPNIDRRSVAQMSLDDLRREYVALKAIQYSQHAEEEALVMKIELLRKESVQLQQSTEIEEEHVANHLLRRLNDAERDVRKYEQLICEEEQAMEDLARQISEIHAQQSEVESRLEQHQEHHLMLQGRLLDTACKKSELERELLDEWQRYLGVLVNQLVLLRDREKGEEGSDGGPASTASPSMLSHAGKMFPSSGGRLARAESAADVPSPSSANVESPEVLFLHCDCITPEATDEEPTCNSATHPTVVQLEHRLNKLLKEHAKAMRGAVEMKQRHSELSRRLKDIQDAAFFDIARVAKYREDLRNAQAKLSEFNGREMSFDYTGAQGLVKFLDQSVMSASGSAFVSCRGKETSLLASPTLSAADANK